MRTAVTIAHIAQRAADIASQLMHRCSRVPVAGELIATVLRGRQLPRLMIQSNHP